MVLHIQIITRSLNQKVHCTKILNIDFTQTPEQNNNKTVFFFSFYLFLLFLFCVSVTTTASALEFFNDSTKTLSTSSPLPL